MLARDGKRSNDMKPIIGITAQLNEANSDYWLGDGYMDCIVEAGGVPVMLPVTDDREAIDALAAKLDGFVFSGGPDMDPEMYNMRKHEKCGFISVRRDANEKAMFERFIKTGKPIMGICRGHQFINVMCGGSLYQDIPSETGSEIKHYMDPPYNRPAHKVSIYPNSPLYKIVKEGEIEVNSCHHQAVCELAPCLEPMALSEDGFIESFYMPEALYLHGYQWHPEKDQHNEYSKKIFRGFIKACIEDQTRRKR